METGTRSHREWDTKTVRRQPTPPPQRSVAHPSRSLAAMTPADVLHLQRLAGNGAVTRYLRRFADLGAVVQREASVEGDPKKLDFMVSRFGDQLKAVFVNATEDQVGTAVRLADAKWRAAYVGAKEKLTRTSATAALDKKEILEALGKTDKELSSQASYLLLTNALTGTFSDEATVWYGYKPAKMAPVPLGSTPALDILQQKGTIEPEDKHADHRLQNSANDNIVKTGADTASTASPGNSMPTSRRTAPSTSRTPKLTRSISSWSTTGSRRTFTYPSGSGPPPSRGGTEIYSSVDYLGDLNTPLWAEAAIAYGTRGETF
jgi:hypothetical protein